MTPPVALTIAGSDPSGGAGIQADLKTFAAFEVYGASVITVLTAQNTSGVRATAALDASFVAAQLDAVLDDLPVAAVKTGMLGSARVIEAVAKALAARPQLPLVVDPVMVATSGDRLLAHAALPSLCNLLLPRAWLVTPNLHEAEVLTGLRVTDLETMRQAARHICERGARAVLVKGGHLVGPPVDVLFDGSDFHEFAAERIPVPAVHGGGCTLSAAITAAFVRGSSLVDAVAVARAYVQQAIRTAPELGHGSRPLNHLVRPVPSPRGSG